MSSSFILTATLVLAVCTIVSCQMTIPPPAYMATEGDKKVCKDNANGRTFVDAKKDKPQSCTVVCMYSDGKDETFSSPDGQTCCDQVGVKPSGLCKDGKCELGGVY